MAQKQPNFLQRLFQRKPAVPAAAPTVPAAPLRPAEVKQVDIPPHDPLLAYLLAHSGAVELARLKLDSPTLQQLKTEGVKVVVPLVSQGELIGLLNLGSRMSEQEYSTDDFRLLNTLATQASPALRVAQLARQQLVEAQQRERIEQELRVARVIQQTLLPKEIPQPEGWSIGAFWQPAREVSGDFYDFLHFEDGRLGIIVADVTDKGVPAAMVMATTRSLLRAAAERLADPGAVLARANNLLHPDIPQKMFVTCLYIILNPATGQMVFANAGHNLPYLQTANGVVELRATGMPLGLLPGMAYEEKEAKIEPGERLLLISDGLVEAHNAQREMYGFPRLKKELQNHNGQMSLVDYLMDSWHAFTGDHHEQEDDITLVTIERHTPPTNVATQVEDILQFSLPSQPGNERDAASRVLEAVASLQIAPARLQKLETAVAEATMNAMEHGNQYQASKPAEIHVFCETSQSGRTLVVQVSDQGGESQIPELPEPNLEAKLAGEQSPRGWGFFLIKNMVDEMNIIQSHEKHTIELRVYLDS